MMIVHRDLKFKVAITIANSSYLKFKDNSVTITSVGIDNIHT